MKALVYGGPGREAWTQVPDRRIEAATEAVGMPATFEPCAGPSRPGGRVANVGVRGSATTSPCTT